MFTVVNRYTRIIWEGTSGEMAEELAKILNEEHGSDYCTIVQSQRRWTVEEILAREG